MALCGADRHHDGQKCAGNENSPRSWGSFLSDIIKYFYNRGYYMGIFWHPQIRAFYRVFREELMRIRGRYGPRLLLGVWGSDDRKRRICRIPHTIKSPHSIK